MNPHYYYRESFSPVFVVSNKGAKRDVRMVPIRNLRTGFFIGEN